MVSYKDGYLKFADGSHVKCYTMQDNDPGSRVYVEARLLPLIDSSANHNLKWTRWQKKGVPVDHMLPSDKAEKAKKKQGTHAQWPDFLPELSLSLAGTLHMLALSCQGHRGDNVSKNGVANQKLQELLSMILCHLTDEETKNTHLMVTFLSGQVGRFDVEKQFFCFDPMLLRTLDPAAILPLCARHLPMDGRLLIADLILKFVHASSSSRLWSNCLSLAQICEDILCLIWNSPVAMSLFVC